MPFYGGLPKRSNLDDLLQPDVFLWATGIEDTFITDPSKRTGRILDEYELTGHYDRWREDLDLMASLGVSAARYGIPWYRVQPSPDRWDWTWPDQTFDHMMKRGVEPIVDLVHYGVPSWLEGGLLDHDYPSRMAEYGARVAERYRGRIRWYTPLNEPRINAWYSGMIGWWPPYRRGWKGFAQVLFSIARAVSLTHRALKEVDPEITCVHVDPADLYFTRDPSLEQETAFRQELVFLALDLISGRVDSKHPLWSWLVDQGISELQLGEMARLAVEPDIIGINCYPLFGWKEVVPSGGRVVTRNRYASGELLEMLAKMYWERYDRPLMITETASMGRRRLQWLEQSVDAVRRLRGAGVPVIGYTWWPMFSIVGWAYRQSSRDLAEHMVHLGLWDLDANLNRMETPVAGAYRNVVSGGAASVGLLKRSSQRRETVAVS
ncbi:MAG: beta-glucosidase [Fimbriimonadaceae bacterium]|jgi:beta-glucosidase/6-phospho-beta-glucosidase/beta-galactosidase|nr:beta-glucosidase [Fimbriimonadaceae bacterium]